LIKKLNLNGRYLNCGFLSGKALKIFTNIIFLSSTIKGFWITEWLSKNDRDTILEKINEISLIIKIVTWIDLFTEVLRLRSTALLFPGYKIIQGKGR
jgi:hypothetical protein